MLGVHSGLAENTVDECSYIFYKDCIKELAIKFQYDAIVHILGNPYVGDSQEAVQEQNPFNFTEKKKNNKLTLEDLKNSGIEIKKMSPTSEIKLIKDMV